jgi:predicted 2-oxoglutarate/Fe(II)-dependent dioxygenase YbiX
VRHDENQVSKFGEAPWPNLIVDRQFLARDECEGIVAAMKLAEGSAATVYGMTTAGSIDTNVRKVLRVRPTFQTIELITERLRSFKASLEKHFGVTLGAIEDPQFLRYGEGDFFVAHQDGNTGLMRLESEQRLISVVIFLSQESDLPEPETHSGGSLVLIAPADRARLRVRAEAGALVAFRSETTHEVTPVTRGERFSIVSWYR